MVLGCINQLLLKPSNVNYHQDLTVRATIQAQYSNDKWHENKKSKFIAKLGFDNSEKLDLKTNVHQAK